MYIIRGGSRGEASLIFGPNWAPTGRKKNLGETAPPPHTLSQGLDPALYNI